MRELSIFIDESGDFGFYAPQSPYYIIAMVFHDQSRTIKIPLNSLSSQLSNLGYHNHCVHAGPIIRNEKEYFLETLEIRRKIINAMITFIKHCDIRYKCFSIDKKTASSKADYLQLLSRQITDFITDRYQILANYSTIKIYYDNGQSEVSHLISSVFKGMLPNTRIKKVFPSEYRLFQSADLLCTMELLRIKSTSGKLSASELRFFGNARNLKKNYLKELRKKEWC